MFAETVNFLRKNLLILSTFLGKDIIAVEKPDKYFPL